MRKSYDGRDEALSEQAKKANEVTSVMSEPKNRKENNKDQFSVSDELKPVENDKKNINKTEDSQDKISEKSLKEVIKADTQKEGGSLWRTIGIALGAMLAKWISPASMSNGKDNSEALPKESEQEQNALVKEQQRQQEKGLLSDSKTSDESISVSEKFNDMMSLIPLRLDPTGPLSTTPTSNSRNNEEENNRVMDHSQSPSMSMSAG